MGLLVCGGYGRSPRPAAGRTGRPWKTWIWPSGLALVDGSLSTSATSRPQRVPVWKKFYVVYHFFLARRIISHMVTSFYCVVIPGYIPTAITLMNAVGTPRSFHLIIFWVLFENVTSLHRCKAVFIGLFEAGRVNEWVVTEKLGDMLKIKPSIAIPKKFQFTAWKRFNTSEIVVGLYLLICPCYDYACRKDYYFIYFYPRSIAFLVMGFGYIGTIIPSN